MLLLKNGEFKNKTFLSWLIVLVAITIGCITIVSTYDEFSPTIDEASHIATGIEWLEKETYNFEYLHPPLARLAMSLPLYLRGVRMTPEAMAYECPPFLHYIKIYKDSLDRPKMQQITPRCLKQADYSLLYRNPDRTISEDDLDINLRLVRLPILLFYILGSISVFLFGTIIHSRAVGVIASVLFATSPPIMAHSGLATTDMAFVGTFIFANYLFVLWILNRTPRYALYFCMGVAITLLSKISSVVFLPICFVIITSYLLYRKDITFLHLVQKSFLYQCLAIFVGAFFMIWSLYRFSVGAIDESFFGAKEWVASLPYGTFHDTMYWLTHTKLIPFPEFFNGFLEVMYKDERGHANYIFGRRLLREGVWYFFPVSLFVKSTLPFILATILGMGLVLFSYIRPRHFGNSRSTTNLFMPLVCTWVILAILMKGDINIGVRHVLHIYPFMAILAAFALYWLHQSRFILVKALPVWLIIIHLASTAFAYPDYLAYFNATAGKNPDRVLLDSDLDWGQDSKRLGILAHELGIKEITVCGNMIVRFYLEQRLSIENVHNNCPDKPVSGWFATSFNHLEFFDYDTLYWLRSYEPKHKAGYSILLYYIEP